MAELEAEILALGETREIRTEHDFFPGIYVRTITVPADTLIVGHAHRAAHMCELLVGTLRVTDAEGNTRELTAPYAFTAPPGRKVGYAVTDVVFRNLFATDETNIEKLEAMLVEKSEAFLSHEEARLCLS